MSGHDLIERASAIETAELAALHDGGDDQADRLALVISELHARLQLEQPWRTLAACKGSKWWGSSGRNGALVIDARRRVCESCPVRVPCLTDAIEWPSNDLRSTLFRGGLTAHQLSRAATWVGAGTADEVAVAIVTGQLQV